ncbi:protoporphyrinogen oxidase [Streptomyces sp. 549]|uniref:protoporphyrinogen oxidase n=1 Tax=Streptomyces sp. 549 TaxID=3049076 RepID=UPI0024C35EB0|nr:protoporphyrinogen oxidase [Streptomyces sp. 549]MDK1475195.1 protoporphyrinogen oxidase [Streptomyces sp. 549]
MRVIVVGGGISGLAAAHRLTEGGAHVTVLEAGQRLGGKLMTGSVAGSTVDLGAESLLARRPEAVDLARAVGLTGALQPPAVAGGAIWTRGAVRPMPAGHVMGVPDGPGTVGEVLSAEGRARIGEEADLPPTDLGTDGTDVAIGTFVAERLGREVVDRLVEPLLGGVYAGDAYRISLRAAVPQLFEAVRSEPSLLAAVRAVRQRAAAAPVDAPVFMGVSGGVGRLPQAVADAVRAAGGEIVLGADVRGLRRTGHGWQVTGTHGSHALHAVHEADAVVIAVPAPAAARLLAEQAPAAATGLSGIAYASMALCTLAFRRADIAEPPTGSGFLVPPVDGRTIKASTFASNKWRWIADQDPGLFVLRTSVGRLGEEALLDREDGELVDLSLHDLKEAVGLTATPVDTAVTRWHAGLPQYAVGHVDRVAAVRDAVARVPGLAVCGAAYDGLGIAACVAGGRQAAEQTLARASGGQGRE